MLKAMNGIATHRVNHKTNGGHADGRTQHRRPHPLPWKLRQPPPPPRPRCPRPAATLVSGFAVQHTPCLLCVALLCFVCLIVFNRSSFKVLIQSCSAAKQRITCKRPASKYGAGEHTAAKRCQTIILHLPLPPLPLLLLPPPLPLSLPLLLVLPLPPSPPLLLLPPPPRRRRHRCGHNQWVCCNVVCCTLVGGFRLLYTQTTFKRLLGRATESTTVLIIVRTLVGGSVFKCQQTWFHMVCAYIASATACLNQG